MPNSFGPGLDQLSVACIHHFIISIVHFFLQKKRRQKSEKHLLMLFSELSLLAIRDLHPETLRIDVVPPSFAANIILTFSFPKVDDNKFDETDVLYH